MFQTPMISFRRSGTPGNSRFPAFKVSNKKHETFIFTIGSCGHAQQLNTSTIFVSKTFLFL